MKQLFTALIFGLAMIVCHEVRAQGNAQDISQRVFDRSPGLDPSNPYRSASDRTRADSARPRGAAIDTQAPSPFSSQAADRPKPAVPALGTQRTIKQLKNKQNEYQKKYIEAVHQQSSGKTAGATQTQRAMSAEPTMGLTTASVAPKLTESDAELRRKANVDFAKTEDGKKLKILLQSTKRGTASERYSGTEAPSPF